MKSILYFFEKKIKCITSLLWGSNPGPSHYKCDALPLCKKGFNDSYIMLYSSNTYNKISLS